MVVSGEPYEGYDFSDRYAKSYMFPLAAVGGLVGGTCGYLLTSLTQRAYPLPTGGMPIVPPWTNGIIVYELTMLGAILTTLVYMFVAAPLPSFGAARHRSGNLDGKNPGGRYRSARVFFRRNRKGIPSGWRFRD